jgi:hypothetical protein
MGRKKKKEEEEEDLWLDVEEVGSKRIINSSRLTLVSVRGTNVDARACSDT